MCTGATALERIRTGMAELAAMEVVDLPDQEVRDQLTLLAVTNTAAALVATRADTFDRRELAELDGFRTLRSWLIGFGRLSPTGATIIDHRARVLRALPALREAALSGTVSAEHVDKVRRLARHLGSAEPITPRSMRHSRRCRLRPVRPRHRRRANASPRT